MRCENNFCIYCNKYECALDEINIDNIGLCTEYISINLDNDTLNEQKKKILLSYHK